jgi:carboxymethylenebutenolidase
MLVRMNEIQRYLAEEIALDCNAGHITRPEALRRLHIMGLSAAVAAALLAACSGGASGGGDTTESETPGQSSQDSEGSEPSTTETPAAGPSGQNPAMEGGGSVPLSPSMQPSGSQPGMQSSGMQPDPLEPAMEPDTQPGDTPGASVDSALPTEAITFAGPRGELQGAFASPAAPRGAVLVIHENRGLNDHTRTVAGRLATAGYAALALDLLSEEGGTASFTDTAAATNALGAAGANPARFVEDMRAALDELERRAPGAKLGAIGFCFGGGMMWRLLASDARLAAVSPFYGALPAGSDFSASDAAVLAFYGETDARINMSRDAAGTALTAAGLSHELVTEPGAGHAFFNDTGMNYNATAAADAWMRLVAFFRQHLG